MPVNLNQPAQAIIIDLINESMNRNHGPLDIAFSNVTVNNVSGQPNTKVTAVGVRASTFQGPVPLFYNRLSLTVLFQQLAAEISDQGNYTNTIALVDAFNTRFGTALEPSDIVSRPIDRTGPGPYEAVFEIVPGHLVYTGSVTLSLVEGEPVEPGEGQGDFLIVKASEGLKVFTSDFVTFDPAGNEVPNFPAYDVYPTSGADGDLCVIVKQGNDDMVVRRSFNGGLTWQSQTFEDIQPWGNGVCFRGVYYYPMREKGIPLSGLYELRENEGVWSFYCVFNYANQEGNVAASMNGVMAVMSGGEVHITHDGHTWQPIPLAHTFPDEGANGFMTPQLIEVIDDTVHLFATVGNAPGIVARAQLDTNNVGAGWLCFNDNPWPIAAEPGFDVSGMKRFGNHLVLFLSYVYDNGGGPLNISGAVLQREFGNPANNWVIGAENTGVTYPSIAVGETLILANGTLDNSSGGTASAMYAPLGLASWSYITDPANILYDIDYSPAIPMVTRDEAVDAFTLPGVEEAPDNVGATSTGLFSWPTSLQTDPATGDVYAAGRFTFINNVAANDVHVVKVALNGTRDVSFAPVFTYTPSPSQTEVLDMKFDPVTNKLYVVGYFDTVGGVARSGFARLNLDGTLDETFPNITFDSMFGDPTQIPTGVALDAAGNVYPIGYIYGAGAFGNIQAVAKISSTGVVDETFNTGALQDSQSSPLRGRDAFPLSNGKVLVSRFTGADTPDGIILLNADGTRDMSFDLGASSYAHAVIEDGGTITIFGTGIDFDGLTGQTAMRFSSQWVRDTNFELSIDNGRVNKAVKVAENLYAIGGTFTTLTDAQGAFERQWLAVINDTGTLALDAVTAQPGNDNTGIAVVHSLAVGDDGDGGVQLWVGGNITYFKRSSVYPRAWPFGGVGYFGRLFCTLPA